MTTRKLERAEWKAYFEGVAKRLPSMRVGVSFLGQDIGVQLGADDSPLLGMSYDSNDGTFEIATVHISHRVVNPREIYIREVAGQLSSVEVVGHDDTKQIIELHALPSLPAT
jgi:hypothetical protein